MSRRDRKYLEGGSRNAEGGFARVRDDAPIFDIAFETRWLRELGDAYAYLRKRVSSIVAAYSMNIPAPGCDGRGATGEKSGDLAVIQRDAQELGRALQAKGGIPLMRQAIDVAAIDAHFRALVSGWWTGIGDGCDVWIK